MIEFNNYLDLPEDFTGVCKFLYNNSIRYYKNSLLHREDAPAIEHANGDKAWYINNLLHREDGPAVDCISGYKEWRYKNRDYGYDNDFTIESWKEKVEELKREEELSIFL